MTTYYHFTSTYHLKFIRARGRLMTTDSDFAREQFAAPSDAIATVGVVCTGERLAVAQEITRDANGVMFLGNPQFSVRAASSVMDAFICGLDSTREQTRQRWLA